MPSSGSRPPTAFLLSAAAAQHDTGWNHPEHQGRMRALASSVGRDMLALHGKVVQVEAEPADPSHYLLVHEAAHVERVRSAVERSAREGTVLPMDEDTRVSDASWDAVTGSTGALLRGCAGVVSGEFRNAFVAARPPGHHALPDRTMGFCLFNHVAVAARWLQRNTEVERVAILDWDVHHGNGTQEIFWRDPSVFFASLHQEGHWPGTGSADEVGEGEGTGTTLNVPIPPGSARSFYRDSFERTLEAIASRFRPEMILISAGFDAMAGDPLGDLLLEPEDFHWMTKRVVAWAEETAKGRVVACLEGGYDPRRTGAGAVAVIRALAGEAAPG